MQRTISFEPDPRTALMCVLGADGQPRPIDIGSLEAVTESWPTSEVTPIGPAAMLKLARDTVVTSLVVYEQLNVAVFWSLLAVEAAIRAKLTGAGHATANIKGKPMGWADLFNRAVSYGLIPVGSDGAPSDIWDAGRQLRNRFAHPEQMSVFSYGMALPMVRTSHVLVAELFPSSSHP